MSRTVLRAFAIMSVSSTLLLLYGQTAGAQPKKVTGTGKVDAVLSQTEMLPGDDPRHAIKLARMSYAYTSDRERRCLRDKSSASLTGLTR